MVLLLPKVGAVTLVPLVVLAVVEEQEAVVLRGVLEVLATAVAVAVAVGIPAMVLAGQQALLIMEVLEEVAAQIHILVYPLAEVVVVVARFPVDKV
jgi:hypothetical protein